MDIFVLFAIAIGLAMDAFAVAVVCSVSLQSISPRHIFRLAFHFGLFQAMMPVLGWLAGRSIQPYIESWDHWVAFGLLVYVGGKTLFGAKFGNQKTILHNDPTRGMSLVILSIATSVDALAVGLSLAMIDVNIFYPALIIGVVTLTAVIIGMLIAKRFGRYLGKKFEIAGGIILIGIGIKILIMHDAISLF